MILFNLLEIPEDVAIHLIFTCAKTLSQRDPSTLAQPRALSIDQSLQAVIQRGSVLKSTTPTDFSLPETLLDLKNTDTENLESLNSREILRLALYVATRSSLEFVDPTTSERIHTLGEEKMRQWEQRRGYDLDVKPVAAEMYLTSEFHVGNDTLHNRSHPISRHLLSALSLSAFCARASGLRLVSEAHAGPLVPLLSEEEMIATSRAGAKYLTKLGQVMFGRYCVENDHQHHAHLHDSEEEQLNEPSTISNDIDNSNNKNWCKYCTGAVSCLVISAIQEFSDELGHEDLNAFVDPKPIVQSHHLFTRKRSDSPPSLITFDHSHEYHSESAVSEFFSLPKTKGKPGSLSDFVTNALGPSIPVYPYNGTAQPVFIFDDTSTTMDDHNDRPDLGCKDTSASQSQQDEPASLSEQDLLKPMTRLEVDLAEAIATPSPVILPYSLYNSMAAISLGLHPSFESVHEAVVSSSRRESVSSECESDKMKPTLSNITNDLHSVIEDSEEPGNTSGAIKPNEYNLRVLGGTVSPAQNVLVDQQTNENLDQSALVSADTTIGPEVGHNSQLYPPESPIKMTENKLGETNDAQLDSNMTPLSNSPPVLSMKHSRGDKEGHDGLITSGISCVSDEVESNPSDTENQSSTLTDVTHEVEALSTSVGSDSNGYSSGSNSSDSATDHSPSEGSDGQAKMSTKHHRRRLLVDDAKRKQEQLERVKEQLKLKALGKIRQQVSFWEERRVLEQKDVGVVEVDDEETITAQDEIEAKGKVQDGERLYRLNISKGNMDTTSGDTGNNRVSIVTGAGAAQGKLDQLSVEPISPGNSQSSQHHDHSPHVAPPRKLLGDNKKTPVGVA
ncbi:hypothetical protein BGZ76_001787 [Entomortierella beljakovae]|nr:hypothetical protein BGZ76_001787 [Entomortierella beljakovae]